jgi:hypothetical protein
MKEAAAHPNILPNSESGLRDCDLEVHNKKAEKRQFLVHQCLEKKYVCFEFGIFKVGESVSYSRDDVVAAELDAELESLSPAFPAIRVFTVSVCTDNLTTLDFQVAVSV